MTTASESPPKFELSFVQLIAGCLAAVTAAVLASFFGVAGTLIGTAIGSIVGTAGTAIYAHSIRRTRASLHHIAQHADHPVSPPATSRFRLTRRNWVMIGAAAVAAFLVGLTVVTGIEAAAGEQLWALVTGQREHGGPTTTIGAVAGGSSQATPTPSAEATPTPSRGAAPGETPTPRASSTPTPTPTSTPTRPPPSGQTSPSP